MRLLVRKYIDWIGSIPPAGIINFELVKHTTYQVVRLGLRLNNPVAYSP